MMRTTTTDHQRIRQWAEARVVKPTRLVSAAGGRPSGALRLGRPGRGGEGMLEEMPWDAFFEVFEHENLALEFQDRWEDGTPSSFCRLVDRGGSAAVARVASGPARAGGGR